MATQRRSPLALAVLALLVEAPMHPYRMQQLIKQRHKGDVINVRQRTSLYQTIDRLLRGGLIDIRETGRDGNAPERTVYEVTESGRDTCRIWMREMLSAPGREFPEFPAAIAFLPLLSPDDVRRQLDMRIVAIEAEIVRIDTGMRAAKDIVLPRLFSLESEYVRAMLTAELEWVRGVVDDLSQGTITWSPEWLQEVSEHFSKAGTFARS